MNPSISTSPKSAHWKVLYRSAILENNKTVLRKRVHEAEEAVLARGREIVYGNDIEEKEALEDALYALRAYKTALEYSEAA